MTYPYGSPTPHSTPSSATYGSYWPQLTDAAQRRSGPPKQLGWVVVVLGVASYASGCVGAQSGGTGWGVRFGVSAAVVAALGLLPRQSVHTKLVAGLAVLGFLEALAQSITSDQDAGWAAIAILVLAALQTVAAILALLAQSAEPGAADTGLSLYDAYAYYAQAAQQYYGASSQQPQQQPVPAQGTAKAEAADPGQAQQSASESYALYAEYLHAQQPGTNPAASSQQSRGRPQAAQPAAGTGMPASGPTQSIRSGTDAAAGSAGQSSPAWSAEDRAAIPRETRVHGS